MPLSSSAAVASALEARFALRVASALGEASAELPHGVSERLAFARQQALARAQAARTASGAVVQRGGRGAAALAWFGGVGGRVWQFASVLPLLALVIGLVAIQDSHTHAQISEAAAIDVDLLGDDLPPEAYRDAGFVEFLKTPRS
ncbi:DUF3619 family protein [Piscinibacter sakaiensis]|uniref:Putative transmembrane protein n=1 Tax=Piscinibacter sakaiensis TaxID=1547922 RepID=A0A0K8P783_PISS1|nr:DUF3619 family protein [Piscinibacter sakaiensis]GAP38481.1 putative transmembrane protein [Piscinibacter sakaiensis]